MRKKFNPEKMNKIVARLYQIAIVKNVSPRKLASFLRVSHMQIYRWFAGDKPKPGSEQLILLGIEKINKAIPTLNRGGGRVCEAGDILQDHWARLGKTEPDDKSAKKIDKKLDLLFRKIWDKADSTEREFLLTDENINGFREIIFLIKKYGIKFHKWIFSKPEPSRSGHHLAKKGRFSDRSRHGNHS